MISNIKINDRLGKWLMIFTGVILVAYPTTRFVVNELRSSYLVILFLLSLIACGFYWPQCKAIVLTRLEKLLLFSFFLMFVVTILSFLLLGGDHGGQTRVGIYLGFLLGIPVYFLFKLYGPSSRLIWGALTIACYIVAARALLEVNGLVEELTSKNTGLFRANGTMHPIRFGDLSLLMAFISLAGALYIKDIQRWMRVAGGLAFICGIIASVLSESRGGWIAVPALLIVSLWPLFRVITIRNKLIVLVAITIGFVAMFNISGLNIEKRFEQAKNDILQYHVNDNSRTSIGLRFDMFEAAYWMFSENTIFGVGVGNYSDEVKRYYESNKERISKEIVHFDNPHNEVLMHLATRGMVGFISLMLLFFVGVIMFVTKMRQYDDKTLFYAISGLMIFVAYAHFGMSISLFMHRDFLLFFVIYVSLFAAGANKETEKPENL